MRHTTIAVLALAAMPALALAQDSSSAGGQRQSAPQTSADSNRAMQSQTQGATSEARPSNVGNTHNTGASQSRSSSSSTSQGRRSTSARGTTLSRENIAQLQTALSNAGCDAGTADGIMGPRTRRAMSCARQKNSVSSDQELYQSLNLDFANGASSSSSSYNGSAPGRPSGMHSADSTRAGAATSGTNGNNGSLPQQNGQSMSTDAAGAHATHGDSAQVGGSNRGRIYPPADSVRRSTTSGSTTPPQRP